MSCPQEGACEIPVPKCNDQCDALCLTFLKNPLNFEHSNFLPFHFGTGMSIVKMAAKSEIISPVDLDEYIKYYKRQGVNIRCVVLKIGLNFIEQKFMAIE